MIELAEQDEDSLATFTTTAKSDSTVVIKDPREALALQMSDFACQKVEERLTGDLIRNSIEEHLLLEFAFESVLRSLLRDPPSSAASSNFRLSQESQHSLQTTETRSIATENSGKD